jgi:hypothetical protein
MINNRFRIEKQILLGRCAVRKMSRSRNLPSHPSKATFLLPSQDGEKENSTERRSNGLSLASTTPQRPISVDTDTEEAFSQGSSWYYNRGRAQRLKSPVNERTRGESSQDPLLSSTMRRKWASDLLDSAQGSDAEGDAQSFHKDKPGNSRLSPSNFLKRLPSFRGIHLSLSTERVHDIKDTTHPPTSGFWSSESSDEDTVGELR